MSTRDAHKVLKIEPLPVGEFARLKALEVSALTIELQENAALAWQFNVFPWPPDWDKVYERTDF